MIPFFITPERGGKLLFMPALVPFQATPLTAPFQIHGHASWSMDRELLLEYRLTGPLDQLKLPASLQSETGFREGLWETTCFECFLGLPGSPDYWEWNFAPSGRWALFEFTENRSRSSRQPLDVRPHVSAVREDDSTLVVRVHLGRWPSELLRWASLAHAPLEASLTAVLDHSSGEKTYWAIAHASSKPDFHARASFTLELSPRTF